MLEKSLKIIESTINQTLPEYPSNFPCNTSLWSRSFICYTPESWLVPVVALVRIPSVVVKVNFRGGSFLLGCI